MSIDAITNAIIMGGGRPFFVGGCVRDELLGLNPKDIDIEVYGLNYEQLSLILSDFGKVDVVGVSFGVIKLTTDFGDFDFSLPRKDSKNGIGHKGFDVTVDQSLTVKEAAARRDFTINAITKDTNGKIHDPYLGVLDLHHNILRATSPQFVEDPLRVLRGMQFCGRFELDVESKTAQMCKSLLGEYKSLAKDRIREEWIKWATKSVKPSKGLQFLVDTGWIKLYPELLDMINCPQDPEWHPEGDVWAHTMHVVDAAAEIATRDQLSDELRLELIFGALCHDMGKPSTTKMEDGRLKSKRHALVGVGPTMSFMEKIGFIGENHLRGVVLKVSKLTLCHMDHVGIEENPSNGFVNRLSDKVSPSKISQLVRLMEADHSGRPPLPKKRPEVCGRILKIAEALNVQNKRPVSILMGRHLVELGMKPGIHFRALLDKAYEAQLDGQITDVDSALTFLQLSVKGNTDVQDHQS